MEWQEGTIKDLNRISKLTGMGRANSCYLRGSFCKISFVRYYTREPMIAHRLDTGKVDLQTGHLLHIGVQGRGRRQTAPKFPQDLNFGHGSGKFGQPFES